MKAHHQRCLAPGCFRAAESGYCAEHASSYHFTAGSKEPLPLSTHKEQVSELRPLDHGILSRMAPSRQKGKQGKASPLSAPSTARHTPTGGRA